MALSRRIARPLLSAIFVAGGVSALRNPADTVANSEAVIGPLSEQLGTDPEVLVQVNGAVQVGAGLLLATGKFRRLAAAALIGSILPTTVAGHRFWEETDPAVRARQRTHFLKNLGLLGGLILAAFDTEGAPSLGWRARRKAHQLEGALALGRSASQSKTTRAARHSKAAVADAAHAGGAALADRVDLDSLRDLVAAGAAAAHGVPDTVRNASGAAAKAVQEAGVPETVRSAGGAAVKAVQESSVPETVRSAGGAAVKAIQESSVPETVRSAGAAAVKAVQESGGSTAETVHQAADAAGTVVGQLEPMAERVAKAGREVIGPYLNGAADRATEALSKLADQRAS